jgi:single-strand DNA-binding protein
MANSIRNCITLVGNLGRDPEVKTFDSGKQVANFSVATNEQYTNDKGETIKETQWHTCSVWGKGVERARTQLVKGKEVLIKGKLTYNSYEDKNGVKHTISEIMVDEFFLMR